MGSSFLSTEEVSTIIAYGQTLLSIRVSANCTAESAILQSGILEQFPEIDLSRNKIGIFGRIVSKSYIIKKEDRVEIYRPLLRDPKEARLLRKRSGVLAH